MHIYKISKLVFNNNLLNLYLSVEKRNNIFRLENPKLIYSFTTNSFYESVLDHNSDPLLINKKTKNIYLSKSEKRNKIHYKNVDLLETRKNKLNNKKKVRDKFEIIDELNNSSKSISDNVNTNVKSFIKMPRNVKNKKNYIVSKKSNQETKESVNTNKEIVFNSSLTVEELANKLSMPSLEITKWLFLQGFSLTVNQVIDLSIAKLVAKHYGFTITSNYVKDINNSSLELNKFDYNNYSGQSRCPVITVFGHVDHGKTTLLDAIRKTSVVNSEVGGITQSIGIYELLLSNPSCVDKLIFLDTPGHEAFIGMRARGAEVTDIAILVVAADDILQTQTIEAINHIRSRNIPFIVVINKIDKLEANTIKLREELAKFNIIDINLGGTTSIIEVSALKGHNLDSVISALIQISEKQNLKSDPKQNPSGTILESYLDKQKGPIAKALVQNGTLYVGNVIVAKNTYAKVKVIVNAQHKKVKSIKSLSLAEIWGFISVPIVGSQFILVSDEKKAKSLSLQCNNSSNHSLLLNTRTKSNYHQENIKKINLILKADKLGSIEAVLKGLSDISQEKIQINVLYAESGEISGKDIKLASTIDSIVLGFNVNVSTNIRNTIDKSKITIKNFTVIYNLIDFVENYMLNLTEVEYEKDLLGKAVVETIFPLNKGFVAGCSVLEGKLKKKSYISVHRKQKVIYNGLLDSLKRLKDDVDEVLAKQQCGVMCKQYNAWKEQDEIECYELKPKNKSL